MKLPFQIVKIFTTRLSSSEVMSSISNLLDEKSKFLFIPLNDNIGSIARNSFQFYKTYNIRSGPANPWIKGVIVMENPTTIEIKISPHWHRVIFFMIFPVIFIPTAFLDSQMTINGILREPTFLERIAVVLFGGIGPIIWCYLDSIRPIKIAENWIKDRLMLE